MLSSRSSSLTTMQWAHLSWRDSEVISEKWATHFQSSRSLQSFQYKLDSCDVTLASKDGLAPLHSSFSTTSSHLPPTLHNQATHCHVWELTSTPAASQLGAFTGSVCQSCFNILPQQHQQWQHHLLRPCTTPSSAYQFHVWVLSPACLIRLQLQPLPLHFLHTSDTSSNQHVPQNCILGGAIVINLFSNSDIFDSYVCFLCCRWPRKRPFVFRTSLGVVRRIKHLIDWLSWQKTNKTREWKL